MNFLCLGTAFLLIQLNMGWTLNYVIKLAGFVLFAAGLGELSDLCRIQRNSGNDKEECVVFDGKREEILGQIKKTAAGSTALCTAAVLCMLALKFLKPAEIAVNVISILLGAAVTVIALGIFQRTVNFILRNETEGAYHFVNDRSNAVRLSESFTKVSLCTLVNLGCDLINRLVPLPGVMGISGFLAAVSKIALYVFIIITVMNFNKIRVDSNKKYDAENG